MRRYVAASLVIGALVACSDFGSDTPTPSPLPDAGETDANASGGDSSAPDTSAPAGVLLVNDPFDDPAHQGWTIYGGDDVNPAATIDTGSNVFRSILAAADYSEHKDDGARLQRPLPTGKSLLIEFDITLDEPASYGTPKTNVQILSLSSDQSKSPFEYIGLYVTDNDGASVEMTATQGDGSLVSVATLHMPYGAATHFAIKVRYGTKGAVQLEQPIPENSSPFAFDTVVGVEPNLTVGLARQNGGTGLIKAAYDNFKVAEIATF